MKLKVNTSHLIFGLKYISSIMSKNCTHNAVVELTFLIEFISVINSLVIKFKFESWFTTSILVDSSKYILKYSLTLTRSSLVSLILSKISFDKVKCVNECVRIAFELT